MTPPSNQGEVGGHFSLPHIYVEAEKVVPHISSGLTVVEMYKKRGTWPLLFILWWFTELLVDDVLHSFCGKFDNRTE